MRKPVGKIPKYVSASSPSGLQRIMLQTQAKLGYGVHWFDIQYVGKSWVAWYYDNDDINLHNVQEKLDGNRDS